ncbi:Collectin-11 [Chamberlinius hualienensis]
MMNFTWLVFKLIILIFNQIAAIKVGNCKNGKSYVETNYEDWRWNPFFCEYPPSSSFCQNASKDSTADITKLSEAILKLAKQIKEENLIKQEKPIVPECPSEFIRIGSFCYFFSKTTSIWQNAVTSCKSKGAELAHPTTKEKNTQLSDYIKKNFPTIDYWWLGATDSAEEGTWRWAHDNSKLSFTSWGEGQPDDAHIGEDCMHYFNGDIGKWYDMHCDSTKYHIVYICEQKVKISNYD